MAKQLIFYIEPTRGIFLGDNLAEMKEIQFPPEIVSNLEIIDKEKLEDLLKEALESFHIFPESLTIILSSAVTFDKDITAIPPEKRVLEIKQFLEIVPFQENSSKIFTVGKKTLVVVANNTSLEILSSFFRKEQFQLAAVVPLILMQEQNPQLAEHLDPSFLTSRVDSFKQYSMINSDQVITHLNIQNPQEKKKSNSRLYILAIVFVGLILILGVVIVISQQQTNSPSTTISPTAIH